VFSQSRVEAPGAWLANGRVPARESEVGEVEFAGSVAEVGVHVASWMWVVCPGVPCRFVQRSGAPQTLLAEGSSVSSGRT